MLSDSQWDGMNAKRSNRREFQTAWRSPSRTRTFVALGAGMAVSVALHLNAHGLALDDAYIHLRVAEHLLQHGVAHFNIGEAVKASSSTGWTLVLAAMGSLFGLGTTQVAVVNGLAAAFAVHAWAWAAQDLFAAARPQAPGWQLRLVSVVAGFMTAGYVLPSSLGLMEAAVTAAVLGHAVRLVAGYRMSGALLLGVAVAFRPELALLVVALLPIYRPPRRLAKAAGAVALGYLPFLGFDLWQYGTPIPQAAVAKRLVYSLTWREAAESVLPATWSVEGASLVIGVTALLIGAALVNLTRQPTWAPVAALGVGSGLLMLAYLASRTNVFAWYRPLYLIPLGAAGLTIACLWRWTWLAVPLLLAPPLLGVVQAIGPSVGHPDWYAGALPAARVQQYLSVGQALASGCPECTLLTSEIGGLGYAFPGTVIDGVGLVSPEALNYHPMTVPDERLSGAVGAIPKEMVARVTPELIVTLDVFATDLWGDRALEDPSPVLRSYDTWSCPPLHPDARGVASGAQLWGTEHLLVLTRSGVRTTGLDSYLTELNCVRLSRAPG